MESFLSSHRTLVQALAAGLLTATLAWVPPLNLAQRLDMTLYDLYSALSPPDPPAEFLLVNLDDPAWFNALASLAYRNHAKLLLNTLPQLPPPALPGVVGPVATAIGGEALLRPTAWTHGGHLWLASDRDGVLRYDRPLLEDTTPLQSLGLAAALELLQERTLPLIAPGRITVGRHTFQVDAEGRRWLRFYRHGGFAEATPRTLAQTPELLTGRIVVAGRGGAVHDTPLGPLTTREVTADIAAGYWQGRAISVDALGTLLAWLVAGIAAATIAWLPPVTRAGQALLPAAGLTALLGGSAILFQWLDLWAPVAAPGLFLLATAGYWAWRTLPPAGEAIAPRQHVLEARRLAAHGRLREAWERYRAQPLDRSLLAEVYTLAAGLAEQGLHASATEAWQRIVELDAAYRDVAELLARDVAALSTSGPSSMPSAATDIESDRLPATLGRYELLGCLGRGAMGSVYLGRDPTINRTVAIKAINLAAEFEADEIAAAAERFLREAETAGRLNHPNIVTIFDAGELSGVAYIAMEYLKGHRLSEHAEPAKLLDVPIVLELMASAADALDYAHSQNVVHRDIKPANIMYDSASGSLKITDFGIARWIDVSRTRTGVVLGTPSFMSPEQLEGRNVNGHTDLFALGVTLYQLLTGQLPFRGTSMTQLMFVIANEPHLPLTAVRADLPERLNAIIDSALAKDPADRFSSGAEMARALRAATAQLV